MTSSPELYKAPVSRRHGNRRYGGAVLGATLLATGCSPAPELDSRAILDSRPLVEAIAETPEACQDGLYAQIAEQGAVEPLTAEGCETSDIQKLQQVVTSAELAPRGDLIEMIIATGLIGGSVGYIVGSRQKRR